MRNLSERLSLIASMVKSGSRVCDVGTDHGYLPAFLYLSGKCTAVCATDIREKPLESAKRNIERLGATGVNLILCDGLSSVTREMADTVIIAGMGGEVISGIIDRCAFLRDDTVELILQPMTAATELREYLAKNGFAVEREQAVCENGKVYSVMQVRYTGTPYVADQLFLSVGMLKCDTAVSRQYIEKQKRICEKRFSDLKSAGINNEVYDNSLRLFNALKQILED